MRHLALTLLGVLLAPAVQAQSRNVMEDASQLLAESFYCTVVVTMSGNIGVMIGLVIAAFGFYKLIFDGPGVGNLILIAGGVLFTAIPTWFENSMDALGTIFNPVGSNTTIVTQKYADRSFADCRALDAEAGAILANRQYLEALANNATLSPITGELTGGLTSNEGTCVNHNDLAGTVLGGGGASRCSSGYGTRPPPCDGCSSEHYGVDFAAAAGTPVLAYRDGVVVRSGYISGGGNRITIDHGNGVYTSYMHMQNGSINYREGDRVSAGSTIGRVGSTGGSTGNHLDFRVCSSASGGSSCVNPIDYHNGT